jgi:hypothetical protein
MITLVKWDPDDDVYDNTPDGVRNRLRRMLRRAAEDPDNEFAKALADAGLKLEIGQQTEKPAMQIVQLSKAAQSSDPTVYAATVGHDREALTDALVAKYSSIAKSSGAVYAHELVRQDLERVASALRDRDQKLSQYDALDLALRERPDLASAYNLSFRTAAALAANE